MKTNNMKKIVVSTLGLVMGAALVGSISGSVAWYQYSTRAAMSMTATSAGTSRNLQIRHKGEDDTKWTNRIVETDKDLKPVTVGYDVAANATSISKFYGQPIYQYAKSGKELGTPAAVNQDGLGYVIQYTYQFRVFDKDEDHTSGVAVADKLVYLQDLSIAAADPDDESAVALAKAIRVHVAGNSGSAAVGGVLAADVESTNLFGKLDIGGAAGKLDTTEADFSDATEAKQITYGLGTQDQVLASYSVAEEATDHAFIVDDSDPYNLADGVAIAKTTASASNDVVITIWLEGWGLVNDTAFGASWDFATYIQNQVKIDYRFVTEAE